MEEQRFIFGVERLGYACRGRALEVICRWEAGGSLVPRLAEKFVGNPLYVARDGEMNGRLRAWRQGPVSLSAVGVIGLKGDRIRLSVSLLVRLSLCELVDRSEAVGGLSNLSDNHHDNHQKGRVQRATVGPGLHLLLKT